MHVDQGRGVFHFRELRRPDHGLSFIGQRYAEDDKVRTGQQVVQGNVLGMIRLLGRRIATSVMVENRHTKARARLAICEPMRPSPTMPRVAP